MKHKRDATRLMTLGETSVRLGAELHDNVKALAKQCNVSYSQMANILMTIGYNQINPIINPDEDSVLNTYIRLKYDHPELFESDI